MSSVSRSAAERLLRLALRTPEARAAATPLQRGAAALAAKAGLTPQALQGGKGISGLLAGLAKGAIKHPIIGTIDAAATGIGLAQGAWWLGKGAADFVSRKVTGDPLFDGVSQAEMRRRETEERRFERARQIEAEARARRITENTMNLMKYAPEVAGQVLAGRRLPKGGVMIGGAPRVDLMQQLADQMGQGAYREQDPMQGLEL